MKRIKNLVLGISILTVLSLGLAACGNKQTLSESDVETTKAVETTAAETLKETVVETVPETTVPETKTETEAITGSAIDAYAPDDSASNHYKELYESLTNETTSADTLKGLWTDYHKLNTGCGGYFNLTFEEYEKLYAIMCERLGEEIEHVDEAGFQASIQAGKEAQEAAQEGMPEGLSEWGKATLEFIKYDLEHTLEFDDPDWDMVIQLDREDIDSSIEPENAADKEPNMNYITKEEAAIIHEWMDNWIAENLDR